MPVHQIVGDFGHHHALGQTLRKFGIFLQGIWSESYSSFTYDESHFHKKKGQLNRKMMMLSTSGLGMIGHPPAKYHQQNVPQRNPHPYKSH